MSKNIYKSFLLFWKWVFLDWVFAWLLYTLDYFENFHKVDSDSFCMLYLMFMSANERWKLSGSPFCLNFIILDMEIDGCFHKVTFKFSGLPWWKFISGLPNSSLCVFVISVSGGVVVVVVFGWGVRVGVCLRAPSVSRRPLQQSWFQACAFPNVLLLRLPWRTLGGRGKEGCIRGFYEIALRDGALDFYSRVLG